MSELGLEVLFEYAERYKGPASSSVQCLPPSIIILFNGIYERGYERGRLAGFGEARECLEEFLEDM